MKCFGRLLGILEVLGNCVKSKVEFSVVEFLVLLIFNLIMHPGQCRSHSACSGNLNFEVGRLSFI